MTDAVPRDPIQDLGGEVLSRDALHLPDPFVAPRTPREALVAEVFGTAMQVSPVGIDDRFADLGGDSFMALQVMLMLEQGHGVVFEAGLLETHDTPRTIAAYLDRA